MKTPRNFLLALAALATPASAATMSSSPTAPVVNGQDIANYGTVASNDKWFAENSAAGAAKGQTFRTGSTAVLLKAITYQTSTVAMPTKGYAIRVGTVAGTAFTQIARETASQTSAWAAGNYVTWTFATPVPLAANTNYGIDVGMTSSTSSWQTGIPYINTTANVYTNGALYNSGTSGTGTATISTGSTDRIFHLDLQHPMLPNPDIGAQVPAGDLTLSWTNLAPTSGSDIWVDVWFGTTPSTMTKVASSQQNLSSFLVNLPGANTYHWRIDSYLNGSPTGTPVQSTVFHFIVDDSDGDGFPDTYELANTSPPSATALNRDDDIDSDGLTNLQEFQLGTIPSNPDSDGDTLLDGAERIGVGSRPVTDPTRSDTDADGLNDGVESNTGIWVSASNTGTNPTNADTDLDALRDGVESNTGIYVGVANTGTSPLNSDTDADGAGDWYEVTASLTSPFLATSKPNVPYPLPDPDNSTGSPTKKVKVYIMSGQSNMVGLGTVSGTGDGTLETMTLRQNKFPNLVTQSGAWTAREDVYYRGVISATADKKLGPGCGANSGQIGPELGFGHVMGWFHDEGVLLLKSSIGNRALGWDILPPGSARYDFGGFTYCGSGDAAEKWAVGSPAPTWTTGGWYAGYEWDRFFRDESEWIYPHAAEVNVVDILDNWNTQHYGATGKHYAGRDFEIAGFVWWQGERDAGDAGHSSRYEQNLVHLINSLRSYYSNRYPGKVVPNAPFVMATLGETSDTAGASNSKTVFDAMMTVGSGNYPNLPRVKTVYSFPLSEGGSGNSHYGNRAGTYMLVGDAMGRAMIDLQSATSGNTFANWMAGYPSVPPGLAGFTQDADGDGIENGVENFFGTNPSVGSAGISAGVRNGSTFTFTHPQNSTPATGVTAAYRWSKDLTTFRNGGETDGDNTTVNFSAVTTAGITTVTATITGTTTAKLFVDVRVTQN